MNMILYEEILIYYYKYKYVYIYTLKNATSLEFTVQQIRILLQSSEPRNVLSVHSKNQFLNSDVFQPSITTLQKSRKIWFFLGPRI